MNVRTNIAAGAACYTVQKNDNLCKIAEEFYGEPCKTSDVNKIYYSNKTTIGDNPSLIYPGKKLYIP